MDILARLEAVAAMPKTWRVTTRYTCGKVKTFDVRNESAAHNHAIGERRKIGKNLIERETGNIVRVDRVEVSKL